MELITKESLRVFGFGHTEIDSKELVKFIADLLTDVKNFRNAREAGKIVKGSVPWAKFSKFKSFSHIGEPMTDEIKHWMDDVNVEDFPSN